MQTASPSPPTPVPLGRPARWLVLAVLMASFFLLGQRAFSARAMVLASLATGWLFASWIRADAARRESSVPRICLALCLFGWPFVFSAYVWGTRSWRDRARWACGAVAWVSVLSVVGVLARWLP